MQHLHRIGQVCDRMLISCVRVCTSMSYRKQTVGYSLQCPTELHKIALAAGAPSLQTSMLLWDISLEHSPLTLLATRIYNIYCPKK